MAHSSLIAEPVDLSAAEVRRAVEAATLLLRDAGWARVSMSKVAEAAGVSRATLYRRFPGGRPQLLEGVLASIAERMLARVRDTVNASSTIETAVCSALRAAVVEFEAESAVATLVRTERTAVLPLVAFDRLTAVLRLYALELIDLLSPRLVSRADAAIIADWALRMVIAYVLRAGGDTPFDLTDDAVVRRLVVTYLLPGLHRPPGNSDLYDSTTKASPL